MLLDWDDDKRSSFVISLFNFSSMGSFLFPMLDIILMTLYSDTEKGNFKIILLKDRSWHYNFFDIFEMLI